ncbi:MAG TPA: hypothetical protein VF727_04985, partial [Allosphingosinicella sp.]
PGFAEAWRRAQAWGRARVADGSAEAEPGLVVRRSKNHGAQIVPAGEGRWDEEAEAVFFAHLCDTANVRAACRAAGFSTTAVYKRRLADAGFAEKWRAARDQGCARIDMLLVRSADAALDPEIDAEAEGLLNVTVPEAIHILRLHKFDEPGAPTRRGIRARGQAVEDMPIEAVRDEVLRRIAAIRAHRERRGEGE